MFCEGGTTVTVPVKNAEPAGVFIAVAGTVIYLAGFYFYRKYRRFMDTVTSPARSVAAGLVRLEGHAVGEEQLLSPLFHIPCFYFALRILQVLDETGHPLTHTKGVRFWSEDETGKVPVDPTGLQPESVPHVASKRVTMLSWKTSEPGALAKGDQEVKADLPSPPVQIEPYVADIVTSYLAAHPWSVTARAAMHTAYVDLEERVIAAHQKFVLLGTCGENPQAQNPSEERMISKGPGNSVFEIVDETEEALRREYARRARVCIWGGAFIFILGLIMFHFAAAASVVVPAFLAFLGAVVVMAKAVGIPVKFR
jgi:hypothetical protein